MWVTDSGANEQMTGVSTHLFDYHVIKSPRSVTLANDSLAKVHYSGTTHLFYTFLIFLLICCLLVKAQRSSVFCEFLPFSLNFSGSRDDKDDWYGV